MSVSIIKRPAVVFLLDHSPVYSSHYKAMAQVARDLKVSPIIISSSPKARGLDAGAIYIKDNFQSPTNLRSLADQIKSKYDVHTVIPLREPFVETAAQLRHYLGASGLYPQEVAKFRDKWIMREQAQLAGVPTPQGVLCESLEGLHVFVDSVGFPIIIKPRNSFGALGVVKINNQAELESAWRNISASGKSANYLAEQFIDGVQYHVDRIVHGGQTVFASLGKYTYNIMGDETEAGGTILRSNSLTYAEQNILQYDEVRLHPFLGQQNGVFHSEYYLTASGKIYFGERAARLPGGPIVSLTKQAYGVDLAELWMQVANNPLFRRNDFNCETPLLIYGATFLITRSSGTIQHLTPNRLLEKIPGVVSVESWKSAGDTVNIGERISTDQLGTVIAAAETEEDLRRIFASVHRMHRTKVTA